jgi:pilus assembly protein Flp/PilA
MCRAAFADVAGMFHLPADVGSEYWRAYRDGIGGACVLFPGNPRRFRQFAIRSELLIHQLRHEENGLQFTLFFTNERAIPMKSFTLRLKQFLISEDGPTTVEYAIMLALIVMVCIAAIQGVGNNASGKFQQAADGLS